MGVSAKLTASSKRHTALPLTDQIEGKYVGMYTKMQAKFWPHTTVKFTADRSSFYSMSKARQVYYTELMRFFGPLDEEVNDNLREGVFERIKLKAVTDGMVVISAQEIVHSRVYSDIIIAVFGQEKANQILTGAADHPYVRTLLEWIRKYREGDSLDKAIVMEFALEGVLFMPAFIAIRLLANEGLMPGLTTANDQVSRDELDHAKWWGMIFADFCDTPAETVHQILREVVQLSDQYQEEAIRKAETHGPIKHITTQSMQSYVRYIANEGCQYLGIPPVYPGAENPYPEVDAMALNIATISNGFEVKQTQYSNDWNAELPADLSIVTQWESARYN